jgi:hypothetical protein
MLIEMISLKQSSGQSGLGREQIFLLDAFTSNQENCIIDIDSKIDDTKNY